MLPTRPAGAPPPQAASKPLGSPSQAVTGRPPGPPIGSPAGAHGTGTTAASAKPPPKGPPPSIVTTEVIQSQLVPRTPPLKAEAKDVKIPSPSVKTQKAPSPARIAPPASPLREDSVKPLVGARSTPRALPMNPPGSPLQAHAGDGKPSVPPRPLSSNRPEIPTNTSRRPPSSPQGAQPRTPPYLISPSSESPRLGALQIPVSSPSGTLPGTKPQASSPSLHTLPVSVPRGPPRSSPRTLAQARTPVGVQPKFSQSISQDYSPTDAPKGPLPIRPIASSRSIAQHVDPDAQTIEQAASSGHLWTGLDAISTGALVSDDALGLDPSSKKPGTVAPSSDTVPAEELPPDLANDEVLVPAAMVENRSTESGGRVSPPPKQPRKPPPSPKVVSGIPTGILPPKSPLQGTAASLSPNGKKGGGQAPTQVTMETNPRTPDASLDRQILVKLLSSGGPGKRRPPPGAPPGRTSPSLLSPPVSRPDSPPTEGIVLVPEAQSKEIVVQHPPGSNGEISTSPSAGLPLTEGMSDDDNNDFDEDSSGGICGDLGKVPRAILQHDLWGRVDKMHAGLMGKRADDGVMPPFDDGSCAKDLEFLRRGRFTVRCIEGEGVRKRALSKKPVTVDVYLRITLGKHKKAPSKTSTVVRKSGSTPNFDSELVSFDIVEPQDFVIAGDVMLCVELWDDSTWSDDLLASVELSALRFMHPDAVPTEQWLPLEPPSGRARDNIKIKVEIKFEPALLGMFILTLEQGKKIGANDPAASPNPYVVASLGEMYQSRSRTVKGGGSTPYFKGEEILLWIEKENWTKDLRLQVRSEDLGTDEELGEIMISVLDAMVMPPDRPTNLRLNLELDGQPAGQLFARSVFLPAGKLTVLCQDARALRETSTVGRMDPYVVFRTDGQAVSLTRKTTVDKDGGLDPQWNETLEMDIVDHYSMWVECFNHDVMEGDELIGVGQCSLLPAFKRGAMDIWIQLTTSANPGPPKAAGEIHCILKFDGPSGVAYPQHEPGVDSFDDSLRDNLKDYLKEVEDEMHGQEAGTKSAEDTALVAHEQGELPRSSMEFADTEIASAFKFLDLDHNMHLGAAEIRHILVCMGELITDEEVDMMITMLDADGDGQVNYEEFHRMVIDPDPSRPDFGTEILKAEPKESGIMSEEMKDRENKKWLMERFVKENDIRPSDLDMAYKRYQNLGCSSGGSHVSQSNELDFNTWLLVFNVEATGQYRKLFKVYKITGTGDGMSPEVTRDKIDFREDALVAVLKANHLSTARGVAKKAQAIMRQVHANGCGSLTLDEFIVMAKKFPNLLFPAQKTSNASEEVALAESG